MHQTMAVHLHYPHLFNIHFESPKDIDTSTRIQSGASHVLYYGRRYNFGCVLQGVYGYLCWPLKNMKRIKYIWHLLVFLKAAATLCTYNCTFSIFPGELAKRASLVYLGGSKGGGSICARYDDNSSDAGEAIGSKLSGCH